VEIYSALGEITKKKYNMAPHFYVEHHGKDCIQAIRSFHPTGGLQLRGGATLISAKDETTWLSRGLRGRCDAAEDPYIEEDAHTLLCVEHGAATLVALD
jgi:hypothetical protein